LKGDHIPRSDHLALHCKGTNLEHDEDGIPVGVAVTAFRVDEDGISTNWLEFSGNEPTTQFRNTCEMIKAIRKVTGTHRIGIMNVGTVVDVGSGFQRTLQAVHDPVLVPKPNPGHALIVGARLNDSELLLALSLDIELRKFA
jgi:hypothetical protein